MFIIVFSNYSVFENKNIDNFNIAFTYFRLDFRFVVFIETKLYMGVRQYNQRTMKIEERALENCIFFNQFDQKILPQAKYFSKMFSFGWTGRLDSFIKQMFRASLLAIQNDSNFL